MAGWRIRLMGIALCMTAASAAAQQDDNVSPSNPSLTATARGIRDAAHVRDITLRRLDVAVEVHGAVAETTVTAAFASKIKEPVEGEFKFALPVDAVVTGYALDIDGKMIDGVLVDRAKAKAVYEERVRRRVDPGLAEVSTDNVFTTRVFPITPERGRIIRVRFVSAAQRDGTIRLPLVSDAPADGWSVAVHAIGTAAPDVTLPDGRARFTPVADGFSALSGGKGPLDGKLAIRTAPSDLMVSRHRSGERYLQIGGALPPAAAATPERLRIYWDRSRSRLDDRIGAEIDLVHDYIAAARPQSVELVAFNSSGAQRATAADADAAAKWLKGLTYRGGTSFAAISQDGPADRCLLFSDGQVTIDRAARFAPACRIDAVTSDPAADRAWLGHLATAHGGHSLLLADNRGKTLADLRGGGTGVVGVDGIDGPLAFVPLDAAAGRWRIVARAPDSGTVTVRFADGTHTTLAAAGTEVAFDGEAALIARDRLALLGDTDRRADYVALSRRYGIASPSLSFVVLEAPQDYVAADVAPPASYPDELRAQFADLRKQADRQRDETKQQRLGVVVAAWQGEVKWWETAFDPNARPKKTDSRRGGNYPPPAVVAPAPMVAPPPPPPPPAPEPGPPASTMADSAVGDVVVTGQRASAPQQQDAGAIEIDAWQPDRPYIKAFDANPAAFDTAFTNQEAKYGKLPAFYLDTAEWLRKHGRQADAIEMVLAALELPTANEVTLGIVADRLERYGAIDRAVELRERHAALDPDRPQPKRYLALALAHRAALQPTGARADLDRAITLLGDVALTPWPSAWDGIELISLVEANTLVPKLRALGGTPDLDPRLVKLLDVDMRVTIDWTTDATDLDLWVDQPDGERSIYSNPLTAIGGQLSNDMTQGYGPEQFLLHRAPDGTYIVQANVYASDQIDPNGASVLTAHLYRNYGRPNQTEQVVDVELIRGPKGGGNSEPRMIGRILVGRR